MRRTRPLALTVKLPSLDAGNRVSQHSVRAHDHPGVGAPVGSFPFAWTVNPPARSGKDLGASGTVHRGDHVEPEVGGQGRPDTATDVGVDHGSDVPGDPERRDRPHLVTQDHPGFGLPGLTGRDHDLARIPSAPGGGDRADGQQPRPYERLVGDDEGAASPGLFVAFDRIEPNDEDRPPKPLAQPGHAARSSDPNPPASPSTSATNSGSFAASAHRSALSASRTRRASSWMAISTTPSCVAATAFRSASALTVSTASVESLYVLFTRTSVPCVTDTDVSIDTSPPRGMRAIGEEGAPGR